MGTRVIAFVDDSPVAGPVATLARTMSDALDVAVEAVHLGEPLGPESSALVEQAGVPCRVETGDAVEGIVTEMGADDVIAGVVGARRRSADVRPAGHIALEVLTRVGKILAVVPPDAAVPSSGTLRRILFPLDASAESARAMTELLDICSRCDVEVVVLHVFDRETIPRFWDQPQYESEAWAEAFLARRVDPDVAAKVRLRTGAPPHRVLDVAVEEDVDAIALGWAQRIEPGRAAVVRRALSEAHVPVMLVPATVDRPG